MSRKGRELKETLPRKLYCSAKRSLQCNEEIVGHTINISNLIYMIYSITNIHYLIGVLHHIVNITIATFMSLDFLMDSRFLILLVATIIVVAEARCKFKI